MYFVICHRFKNLVLTVSGGDGDRHIDIASTLRPLAAIGRAGCGVPPSIRHDVAVDQVCCGTTVRTLEVNVKAQNLEVLLISQTNPHI